MGIVHSYVESCRKSYLNISETDFCSLAKVFNVALIFVNTYVKVLIPRVIASNGGRVVQWLACPLPTGRLGSNPGGSVGGVPDHA